MARTLTAAMQSALLRTKAEIVILAEVETDGGTVRVWSGYGDLTFQGNTFGGVGDFGSVSAITETQDLAAQGIELGISGISQTRLSQALQDIRQGHPLNVWVGVVKNWVDDNFISNGFFDADISGWTDASTVDASISWNSAGYLDLNDTASGNAVANQQLSGLTIGKEYNIFWRTADPGPQGLDVSVGIGGGGEYLFLTGQPQEVGKAQFTPAVTNPTVSLQCGGDSVNDTVSVDYVAVLENEPVTLIADPVNFFKGVVDKASINEGSDTATIAIRGENRLIRLERKNERRYTTEDQRLDFPNDKGFEYVEAIQDRELQWGRGA